MALAVTVRSARARAVACWRRLGVLAVAAIFFAGAVQLEPIPAAELNHLAAEIADPASVQHCTTASQVRYCLYPGFGRDLPSIEAPVNKVLALLPAPPGQPLTVQQVLQVDFADSVPHPWPAAAAGIPVERAGRQRAGQCPRGIGDLPGRWGLAGGRRGAD